MVKIKKKMIYEIPSSIEKSINCHLRKLEPLL